MLSRNEQVLGLKWVKQDNKPKLVVTRWANGRRNMTYEPLPFRPYGFVRKADVDKLDLSSIFDPQIEQSEIVTIFGEPVCKISVPIPQDIKAMRDYNRKIQFYEADIPYGKRVFTDLDLNLPTEYKPAYCDIETDPRNATNKSMQEASNRVLSAAIVSNKPDLQYFVCDGNEADIYLHLNEILREYTCMVSWSDFDFTYLTARAEVMHYRAPYVHDIEGIDLMYYFAQLVLKKTTQSYVKLVKAIDKMQELGANVDTLPDMGVKDDYSLVYKYFVEDREKLRRYNMADATSMAQLDQELQLSKGMYELMRLLKIWPTEFRQHSKIDDMVKLRLARARGVVLPNRPETHYDIKGLRGKQKADKKGAHVFAPVQGFHRHVIVLDFAGMYPAIMLSLNIGLDSLLTDDTTRHYYTAANSKKYKVTDCLNTEYLKLVQTYFAKYDAELKAAQPDTLEYAVATAKRLKMKLIKNADFGITGYKTGRLYNAQVFESITLTGQALIKFASAFMQSRYNLPTIYGDTDSLFVLLPGPVDYDKLSKTLNNLNLALQEFSKDKFGAPIDTEIELDYYADRAYFTHAKKRYVMHVAAQDWPPKPCDYVKIMGFETQRRDWVELSKEVQRMIFDQLLRGISPFDLEHEFRQYFMQLKDNLFAGKLDDKIIFTKGIRQELKDYASSLPHTRAAKILQDLGLYQTGSDIEYFVIGHDKVKSGKVDSDGKPVVGKKGKQLTQTKQVIETYPNIPNRPAIRRSGYSYVWQAQIMAILERVGMYKDDVLMFADPNERFLDHYYARMPLLMARGLSK